LNAIFISWLGCDAFCRVLRLAGIFFIKCLLQLINRICFSPFCLSSFFGAKVLLLRCLRLPVFLFLETFLPYMLSIVKVFVNVMGAFLMLTVNVIRPSSTVPVYIRAVCALETRGLVHLRRAASEH